MLDIVDDMCTIIIHHYSCLGVLLPGHLFNQCACQLLISLNLPSGKKGKL